jgi:vacuolar-type H+-ATPase subunit E/Vma4
MEFFYEPGTRDPSELQEFVQELLEELHDGGAVLAEARDAGLDVDQLSSDPGLAEDISIESGKSGFDPITTVIIVTVVRPIVLDLWRQVLLPRIVRRWTTTAIGKEVKPDAPPPDK